MRDKEQIFEQIRLAGYNYAKELFCEWRNLWDNKEDYSISLDENGMPKENVFCETVSESSYHNYCSGDNDDFFDSFEISGVSQEERKCVEDDELYDFLDEGITKFINETYHNA